MLVEAGEITIETTGATGPVAVVEEPPPHPITQARNAKCHLAPERWGVFADLIGLRA